MVINLKKGQSINLEKSTSDLSSVTIGLGWKIRKKGGFLSGLFGGGGEDYDLDAIAFLLDADGKVQSRGDAKLVGGDVIFFNNLKHSSGCVVHTGDNLVGGAGVEDDEQIVVKLDALDQRYHRILFLVTIYQGTRKKQHFGEVEGAFMRAVDAKGKELARFRLGDDPAYNNKCTVVFGEVSRQGSEWKFQAIGDAYPTDSFVPLLEQHLPR
jgi:stress response protein SCP2